MPSASPASAAPAQVHARGPALLQVVAAGALFTVAAAYQARHLSALTNDAIWWHLRTGLWMLQTHSIPRTGLSSQASSLPWIDASWAFDLLSAFAHRLFGLAGLPVLLMLLQVATAVALFVLALDSSRKFWLAVVLAAVAQCCIVPLQLRPALCSIAFLGVELALLLRARRTGEVRALYWLPLVFLLWVNLGRQFSYGLVVLALFCLAVMIEQLGRQSGWMWLEAPARPIRLSKVGAIAAASFLATFISPYTWHLHALVWQSATNSAADRYFRELHSMRFRQPQEYLLMLLAMTAFFALGRRRSRDLFLISLLIVSAVISFRLVRDNWLVVVVSVAIIGEALGYEAANALPKRTSRWSRVEKLSTAALVLLVIFAIALRLPTKMVLLSKVSQNFPVRASDYIRQSHLPQPMFNTYEWGGFLTWYLPEYPVSIDSRIDLYGDALNIAYFKLMLAEVPLESDPSFARARTFLLEAGSPMAQALSTLPGFRVAYQDTQAIVLVRRD